MKNDSDCTLNENEKKKGNYEGVIINDRETLQLLIEKAGCDTIDELYKGKVFDIKEGYAVAHALGIMSENIENAIMPREIDEE